GGGDEELDDGGESVGRAEGARDEIPEPLLHLDRETPGGGRELRGEERSARRERLEQVMRRARPRAERPLGTSPRGEEPGQILAHGKADRRRPRRCDPPAARLRTPL